MNSYRPSGMNMYSMYMYVICICKMYVICISHFYIIFLEVFFGSRLTWRFAFCCADDPPSVDGRAVVHVAWPKPQHLFEARSVLSNFVNVRFE